MIHSLWIFIQEAVTGILLRELFSEETILGEVNREELMEKLRQVFQLMTIT